jgi:competence protein ComEC
MGSGLLRSQPADELRCTFLAVGRGGCTVLELPDGRTILYDTGAMAGPELTQRQVAPYLWHCGIRRIDEVWISHADLDHFNGLPALLECFAVGQVTLTPSFADKRTPGVPATLSAIAARGVPTRIVHAGQRMNLGQVQVEILHPPTQGPDGNENARSLVLLVRHAKHTLLLTGDLEGPGMQRVLALPAPRIDILMAPHHGSHIANTPELADWAQPRLVIASQGPPLWPARQPDPYEQRHIPYLGTWPHGAIAIRSRPGELTVETFRTNERISLK